MKSTNNNIPEYTTSEQPPGDAKAPEDTSAQPPLAGWYPDPGQPLGEPATLLRWWDGRGWSASVLHWTGQRWSPDLQEPAGAEVPMAPVASLPVAPQSATPPPVPPDPAPDSGWGSPGPDPATPDQQPDSGSGPAESHPTAHAQPDRPRRGSRRLIAALTAAALLLAGGAAAAYVLLRPDPERLYLEELRAAGLGGQYSSDANAVASGQAACTRMRDGAPQTGSAGDEIAVKHFCPEFAAGFHVLSEITVDGSFTLLDTSYYYSSSIDAYGGSCEGTGGYSDISPGTPVVLENGEGKTLATTSLGFGTGTSSRCVFRFTLPVKEGESDYVVSVGDRGEMHYTFTQLDVDGITLTLGD